MYSFLLVIVVFVILFWSFKVVGVMIVCNILAIVFGKLIIK